MPEKNYALARHIVALGGGLVDVAHQLKDDIGGSKVQRYLQERVESLAEILERVDRHFPGEETPRDQTLAFLMYDTYQHRRDVETRYTRTFRDSMSLDTHAKRIKHYYHLLGKNHDAMVRVYGGRMAAETCAKQDMRNVRHAAENITKDARRYESYYQKHNGLINQLLAMFIESEQNTDKPIIKASVDAIIEDHLKKCTIEQRIILTRVFGKDLMGDYSRQKLPTKKRTHSNAH
jgi:hypothetical protein